MADQEGLKALIVQDEIARGLPLPSYGRPGDACRDIPSAETVIVPAFGSAEVRTGIRLVPPPGYYFRVVGKGSSAYHGLFFTLEVIDPTYRGEIILFPRNASNKDVEIKRGQCIAQLELVKMHLFEWEAIDIGHLDKTERGEGRMNSTGTGIPVPEAATQMSDISTDDLHRRYESEGVDASKVGAPIPQWADQWNDNDPPPYYENDRGWSKDRDKRSDKLTKIIDQDRLWTKPPREHSRETLDALRILIDETEDAVRNNPETRAGMTWIEQSKFVQGLLYDWYRATRDRNL